ncbi:MAG TPA: hypothetical protein VGG09_07955 [Acidimicrobiales bacterium]|jgi:hypothetical protein
MAYVVARPKERYEIRESVHTPKGPRARSLANFATLTDEVLETAQSRASRPFDASAVRASARRAGSPVRRSRRGHERAASPLTRADARRFVAASRRMARSLDPEPPRTGDPGREAGDALIDLLGFVAQIAPFRPEADLEPLRFPLLARLRQAQRQPQEGVRR